MAIAVPQDSVWQPGKDSKISVGTKPVPDPKAGVEALQATFGSGFKGFFGAAQYSKT